MGQGPRTGCGTGNCPGGRGFGCRNFFTKKEESEMLAEEQSVLELELEAVKERLAEIKGQN